MGRIQIKIAVFLSTKSIFLKKNSPVFNLLVFHESSLFEIVVVQPYVLPAHERITRQV